MVQSSGLSSSPSNNKCYVLLALIFARLCCKSAKSDSYSIPWPSLLYTERKQMSVQPCSGDVLLCLSQETGLYLAEGQMVLSVSGGSGVILQEQLPLRKVRRLKSSSPCGHSGWRASIKLVPVVVHSRVTQHTSALYATHRALYNFIKWLKTMINIMNIIVLNIMIPSQGPRKALLMLM